MRKCLGKMLLVIFIFLEIMDMMDNVFWAKEEKVQI